MLRITRKLKDILRPPAPDINPWKDVLVLVIFGAWSLPFFYWLVNGSEPGPYPCHGPGFVDFGCTGSWEAIVSNMFGILFELFIFSVFLVALIRLINWWKKNRG